MNTDTFIRALDWSWELSGLGCRLEANAKMPISVTGHDSHEQSCLDL